MRSKLKHKVAVLLTEEQMKFVEEFAQKRDVSNSQAIRIIVDVRRRQEPNDQNDR